MILDSSQGFTSPAVLEFGYIDHFDSPTPPGFTRFSFTSFASGLAWDFNTGVEGVTITWADPISEPLPAEASFYEARSTGGNYVTESSFCTWDSLTFARVPEPSVPLLCGLPLLPRKRNNSQDVYPNG